MRRLGSLVLILPCSAVALLAADADLILHNGKITTLDSKYPSAHNIAIRDGRIVGVDDAESYERGPATRVIDLKGRRVIPDVSEDVGEVASWITPRLGGVGPTTVAMLLRNTVTACSARSLLACQSPTL